MAKPHQLLLALLVLSWTASSRAEEENAIGELVRSGTAIESVAAPAVAERELDFRFQKDIPSAENPRSTNNANVRPAVGDDAELAKDNSTSGGAKARRLAPRNGTDKPSAAKASLSNPTESLITMGGSLCVVLSLFFGLAWITRRSLPKNRGKLPGEVIEVLGKTPLVKGQELQLVRVGAKLLLICVTPTGCETLTEIVDRGEVDRLSTICRSNGPSSMTAAFNQVLTGIGREPASGFAGSARSSTDRRGGRAHA